MRRALPSVWSSLRITNVVLNSERCSTTCAVSEEHLPTSPSTCVAPAPVPLPSAVSRTAPHKLGTPAHAGPHALIVLKDGHVGSEWFADLLARQPGTRFIFEAGPCVTRSLKTKIAFVVERRGCACTKEDCSDYKKFFADAPCLDEPSARSCRLLGHSHISVTTKGEAAQWEAALRNATPGTVTVLVQTRSNLMKWAWSFYRTGAMARLRLGGHEWAADGHAVGLLDAHEIFVRVYTPHTRPWFPFHKDRSELTVNIALSDDGNHKGGRLIAIYDGAVRAIERREGTATLHPSSLMHAVSRMTEGTRHALIIFFGKNKKIVAFNREVKRLLKEKEPEPAVCELIAASSRQPSSASTTQCWRWPEPSR
mgnify:CR=1 FL=1